MLEVEKGADTSLLKLILLTSIQTEINECVTAGKELNDNLFFEDKFAGDEQKNVAEGQEVWEAATCGVTSAGVKPEATKVALTTATSMLATRRAVTVKATTTAETTEFGSSNSKQINFQIEERLDIEIESIRRLMMKVSQRQETTTRKQKNLSKRKTTKYCESTTSGTMQHKVWRPGEEQQIEAVTSGKL